MAYRQETILLTQGDTLPPVSIRVLDPLNPGPGKTLDSNDPTTWSRVNLTSAESVVLLFKGVNDYSDPTEIPCVVTSASIGEVVVHWPDGILDEAGEYEGKIRIYLLDPQDKTGLRLMQWTSKMVIPFDVDPLF